MKWGRLILGLVLILVIWTAYVAYALATAGPEVRARWGYVDEKTTEIWVEGKLSKPLLIPLKVENLSLSFMGIEVARGARFDYGATKRRVGVALVMDNEKLVRSLVAYLKNDQTGDARIHLKGSLLWAVPLNLNLKQTVHEDVLSKLNFTVESREVAGGLVKSPALVGTTFEWVGERDGKAILRAHLKLHNPNGFPVPVGNVSFEVYANGVKVMEGKTLKTGVIPGKGDATLNVEVYIDESVLPGVWATHVKNGEVSRVRGDLYLDATLLGVNYRIKLASYERKVETNILGTINEMLESG